LYKSMLYDIWCRTSVTYAWEAEQRAPYAHKSMAFIDGITDTLSKKMVRKVNNRWGDEIWPWDKKSLR
ncbi:MAG: hypothetical protein EB072_20935, partial [Betaproteobacteria bacterium]|nr:hypothetical protein [Betaproteobacteria bacterium]